MFGDWLSRVRDRQTAIDEADQIDGHFSAAIIDGKRHLVVWKEGEPVSAYPPVDGDLREKLRHHSRENLRDPRDLPSQRIGRWITSHLPGHDDQDADGGRFLTAIAEATRLHAGQVRKGTEIPYIAHLLSVAALVIEDGGSENEAIAALLHDAVEDAGRAKTLEAIHKQFGDEVAMIVEACSDTDVTPKPPWRERKVAYLDHLRDPETPESVLRVSLADKLHNARAILSDYRRLGDDLWSRFNTKSGDDQLWYYRSLAEIFESRIPGALADELRRVTDELATAMTASRSD
jgi:hypothetical protein